MYNETITRITFVLVFVGFNLTFIPQFILGQAGMPRRYFDYLPEFEAMHTLSTIGAYVNALGYSSALVLSSLRGNLGKVKAPINPYNGLSLEWQTASPPPTENFLEQPVVGEDEWVYAYGKPVPSGSH